MDFSARRVPYDDEYATCERTYAELRIYTGDLDPEIVTERLRVTPTQINRKGEQRTASTGRRRTVPKNGWFLSSESDVESHDLRRHLDWLLARLSTTGEDLRGLQQHREVHMSITCVWWSAHGDGGPTLWPEQMKLMAELGLECCFELAFYGDDEEDE